MMDDAALSLLPESKTASGEVPVVVLRRLAFVVTEVLCERCDVEDAESVLRCFAAGAAVDEWA